MDTQGPVNSSRRLLHVLWDPEAILRTLCASLYSSESSQTSICRTDRTPQEAIIFFFLRRLTDKVTFNFYCVNTSLIPCRKFGLGRYSSIEIEQRYPQT